MTSRNYADRLLLSLESGGKANTPMHGSAIDVLQTSTANAFPRAPESTSSEESTRPPTARRAASTGGIGLAGSSRSNSHSPSPTTWKPGMPLPPPPPGPPPAGARSQSLDRPIGSPSNNFTPCLPFRQRRPPGSGTTLETIPPTPADWKEEGSPITMPLSSPRSTSKGPSPLHIDTSSSYNRRAGIEYPQTTTGASPAHSRRDSSCGGLYRSPAVRNRSAKGIRERRSESRNGKGRNAEVDSDSAAGLSSASGPWSPDPKDVRPMDLVLLNHGLSESKHKVLLNSSPKSAQSMQSLNGALHNVSNEATSGKAASLDSSRTTPLPDSTFSQRFSASTSTPPFSPIKQTISSELAGVHPPLSNISKTCSPSSLQRPGAPPLSVVVSPGAAQRPISHILHILNQDESIQIPLTPSTKAMQEHTDDLLGPESPKAFAGRANERHRMFAEREAQATNDSDRLDLFIEYIIAESKIRREQYASVFNDEGVDLANLTEDLFKPTDSRNGVIHRERAMSRADTSKRTSIASSALGDSSSQGDVSAMSRTHESPSSATTSSSAHHRPESTWWKDYIPSLSPIASMSIVTGQDEMDSRGRTPSRWWEDKSHSEDHGDAFNVLERSKRESKYMGVSREARHLPAVYESGPSISASTGIHHVVQSQQPPHGSNEYPPEKVGWHEEDSRVPQPSYLPHTPLSAPFTPDPRKLDISRLVTLPPPYPRHHPAVNNNHPDLADIRAVVRSLNEKDEPQVIRNTYESQDLGRRQRANSWCQHQRSLHRQDVEFRIEHGDITQEQYNEAEAELESKLHRSEREITQTDFDLFQESVLTPLHTIFSERIKLATCSLEKLSSRLFSDAQSRSPNLPQEEGDEQPELLEKLTQLKWLFEVRESIHRQIFDILSERNDRYKAIILLPYEQNQNQEKRAEAEQFFAQDALERSRAFEEAVHSRAESFLSVVENNVARGVEVQLSAFWDIAPSLLEILHKIPLDLAGFEVQIPPHEYEENPSYDQHPLQYLYSLLGHAEKSSYQFIESQTNLLCLLHEIRCHELNARCRVEAQGNNAQGGEEERKKEEVKLTEDLKEKVGIVEGQWGEAIGDEFMEIRERVRGWLLEQGGFEEEEVV